MRKYVSSLVLSGVLFAAASVVASDASYHLGLYNEVRARAEQSTVYQDRRIDLVAYAAAQGLPGAAVVDRIEDEIAKVFAMDAANAVIYMADLSSQAQSRGYFSPSDKAACDQIVSDMVNRQISSAVAGIHAWVNSAETEMAYAIAQQLLQNVEETTNAAHDLGNITEEDFVDVGGGIGGIVGGIVGGIAGGGVGGVVGIVVGEEIGEKFARLLFRILDALFGSDDDEEEEGFWLGPHTGPDGEPGRDDPCWNPLSGVYC